MKRLALLLCVFTSLYSNNADWTLAVRGAYFHPTSKRVQRIYCHAGDVQFEASRTICNAWKAWASINYFSKRGKSIGFCNDTRLRVIPLSLGVKYLHWLESCLFKDELGVYVGFGGTVTVVNICDNSNFVHRRTHKTGGGFVVKSGINWQFNECFFLDFFVDYYHQKMKFCSDVCVERNTFNISGVKIGAGVGITF